MIPPPKDQYDLRVPGANDFLAVSQSDFLSNFGQLYNSFVANHIALDSVTLTPGNHMNIQLLEQGQGAVTNVGEISLYSKKLNQVNQKTTQLYLRYQGGNPQGQEVQITNYQLYSPSRNETGLLVYFTYLPGGLILYFGTVNFSKTNAHTLYLDPFICTNIMAFNFCSKGPKIFATPTVTFLSERDRIITTIQAQPFDLTPNPTFPNVDYYFIVLGNTT